MNTINTRRSLGQMLLVMFICSLLAAPAWSAEVTYTTDAYATGDTLTASGLNDKFNDIKAGVNDNHSNIGNNTAAIDALNANAVGSGTNPGDMKYWNGTSWVLIPAPSITGEATLKFVNGSPSWKPSYYKIGDTGPAGGVVFYITDGGAHGLEAGPLTLFASWGCDGDAIDGADGNAVGTGANNTANIVAQCGDAHDAAERADGYTLNGYSDWFLPSASEMSAFVAYRNINDPTFPSVNNWTSTQDSTNPTTHAVAIAGYPSDPPATQVRQKRRIKKQCTRPTTSTTLLNSIPPFRLLGLFGVGRQT